MTILYSLYPEQGIVFAADSMLTRRLGRLTIHEASRDPKVFRIPSLGIHSRGALLGYYGLAQVRGQPMAKFLRGIIRSWQGSARLEDFAIDLINELQRSARAGELRNVLGFHLGGFESRGGYRVPIFIYVRNAEADENTGIYKAFENWELRWEEQMMARTLRQWQPREARQGLRHFRTEGNGGIPMWFRNGDLEAFAGPTAAVEGACRYLASRPRYAMPDNVNRWADLAKVLVDTTSDLVRTTYTGGTPTIGGRAFVETLDWDG